MPSYDVVKLLNANGGRWTTPSRPTPTRSVTEPAPAFVPTSPCDHLGDVTGDIALVKCGGCRGNVRIKTPTHHCAVFGSCLPTEAHENSSDVKGCGHCPRREVATAAAPDVDSPA